MELGFGLFTANDTACWTRGHGEYEECDASTSRRTRWVGAVATAGSGRRQMYDNVNSDRAQKIETRVNSFI